MSSIHSTGRDLNIMIRDVPLKNSIELKNYLKDLLLKHTNELLIHKDFLTKSRPFLSSYFSIENIKRVESMGIEITYSEKENEHLPYSTIAFHKVFKIVEKQIYYSKPPPFDIPSTTLIALLQIIAKEILVDIIITNSYHQLVIHKLRVVYDRETSDVTFQVFYYFLRIDYIYKNTLYV